MSQSGQSSFVYVAFIRTTPEKLWSALTDPDQMREYWFGMRIESEWKKGAEWRMLFPDGRVGDTGEILEFNPPKRMRLKWRNEYRPELKAEGVSLCTMELDPVGATVRLTITHSIEYPESKFIQAVSGGWPKIISNLKSLLETGDIILTQADHTHAR